MAQICADALGVNYRRIRVNQCAISADRAAFAEAELDPLASLERLNDVAYADIGGHCKSVVHDP
jgi:hypothetical protein